MSYLDYNAPANTAELVQWATEIKVRAERRAGEMLRVSADAGERVTGRPEKVSQAATLSDLGISRTQSSRWQQVASIPDEHFEAAEIWGNGPGGGATKVSKAPFVPFVAPYLAPSRQIEQGAKHGD